MNSLRKILLVLVMMGLTIISVKAESLFIMSASQTYYAQPKSLYGGVRARSIGDILTIVIDEKVSMKDNLNYNADRTSKTTNNFTDLINSIFGGEVITPKVNNFGGGNTVESKTQNNREMSMTDKITVQVVQLLPNGNLLVQGKKTLINTGERVDVVISGVVDPRYINDAGQVSSSTVANLQFAMSGKGSVSRSGGEGIINRFVRYLF